MKHVIFDIDGTIADCSHRLYWIKREKKDYDRFYADCILDEPIVDVLQMVMHMYRMGYEIIFCTGRSNTVRKFTESWLRSHLPGIYFSLYMRGKKDYRPDHIVKIEMMKKEGLTPHNVFAVFEDRDQVVDAWRDAGYRCYQVKKGDY